MAKYIKKSPDDKYDQKRIEQSKSENGRERE